eukprot:GHVU01089583.1.p1 GENE.GHVU01089583.1~~GHVU01089583.1.p1  ORF type:complete len:894 (+),score=151.92 GHVU01089583.1:192-2873(+)
MGNCAGKYARARRSVSAAHQPPGTEGIAGAGFHDTESARGRPVDDLGPADIGSEGTGRSAELRTRAKKGTGSSVGEKRGSVASTVSTAHSFSPEPAQLRRRRSVSFAPSSPPAAGGLAPTVEAQAAVLGTIMSDDQTPTTATHGGRRADIKKGFGQILLGQEREAEQHIREHLQARSKTNEDRELIHGALRSNLVCSSLNDSEIDALVDAMQYFVFKPGDTVCYEEQEGSYFFVIDGGSFDVYVKEKKVNTMLKGKAFGEVSLIHNTARSASVVCLESGNLWGVDRLTFRETLKNLSSRNYVENRSFLNSVKIFEMLTDNQKDNITNSLVVEKIARATAIVREGERGDVLYIVKEGEAVVTIQGKEVRTLSKGDYFGERSLLYDEARSATITATVATTCLSVNRQALGLVLGDLQHVLFRNVMMIALQSSKVFKRFEPKQLSALTEAAVVKDYPQNFTILNKENKAKGVRFFIVLEGDVMVSQDGRKVGRIRRGESFGDDYVLNNERPFDHRVDAILTSKLALLTSAALIQCFGGHNIEQTLDYNKKLTIVKNLFIFRYLGQEQIDLLINSFKTVRFVKDEPIVKEGETGSRFFIIKSGEVLITKGDPPRRLRTCGKHDYFGERALLFQEPRTATVTATSGEVDLWVVDSSTFERVVERDSSMRSYLLDRIKLQDTRVEMKDLVVVRVVGRGTFGVVKLVKHKPSSVRYALKCVSRRSVIRLEQQEHIRLEREILAENDHPFIIKLVRTFRDQQFVYFLTELVTGGELYDAIRRLGLLDRTSAQFYLGSIVLAIECLHERHIAYRDLKPENLLLDAQGYIKLIDFGCAKKLQSGKSYTMVGTPHYMAPEVILGEQPLPPSLARSFIHSFIHALPYQPTHALADALVRSLFWPL